EHVYPFTDVVTTTTHVPPRTKGGHDLLQAGWADGDGALRQDHGVAQEAQLWAHPGASRPRDRSASGYTWASPPASSTSSPLRPPPRSPPPSQTMPPLRRGLLCPTCRQVEIVCVALVN
ncbi:hypothetical protein CFC21_057639, partial [Triticum aestivum]